MTGVTIDPTVAVRNTAVSSALELVEQRRALYRANRSEFTRYQLVAAEQRMLSVCRILGLA